MQIMYTHQHSYNRREYSSCSGVADEVGDEGYDDAETKHEQPTGQTAEHAQAIAD